MNQFNRDIEFNEIKINFFIIKLVWNLILKKLHTDGALKLYIVARKVKKVFP